MRSRRWFLRMLLLAAVLAIGVGWILIGVISLSSIEQVEARVDTVRNWGSLIRLGLIAAMAIVWRPVILRMHAGNRLLARPVRDWLIFRWRVVFWLMLLELFIGQNLLGEWMMLFSQDRA